MTSKTFPNTFTEKKIVGSKSFGLPIRGNLTLAYVFSLMIAIIVGSVSLIGILSQTKIYPTEEFLQTFVATDVVKLCIGLPILLGSMWQARRGKLIGLLFWPGALFYILYSYLICVFAMPLSWMFLFYLALVMLSLYTMIALIASIDGQVVQQRFSGNVPDRLVGGILAGFGISFLLLAASVMVNAAINQIPLATTELALQTADFLVTPTWLIGGVLLWRRKALGYVVGTALLFQSSMLMVSLLGVILLKPILTTDPFVLSDFVAIFIFGLICFIPLTLFIRGVVSPRSSASA